MNSKITKLSACLALFVVSGYVVCPTYVRADASGTGLSSQSSMSTWATVAHMKPVAQKAIPLDPSKSQIGDFVPVNVGDTLAEGTVVKTGKDGYLEMKWNKNGWKQEITTRLWQESMARIAPNSRWVFLSDGDLVFRKPRSLHEACTVETKRLQARIRGTTVHVRCTPDCDSIEVLETEAMEHPVEVKNLLNGSVVNLTPGVVLEIRGKIVPPKTTMLPEEQPIAQNNRRDLRLDPSKGELIFEDKYSTTMAYTANAKAVLEDPMVVGGPDCSPIDSVELIKTAMASVPSSDDQIVNFLQSAINFGHADKLVTKNLSIARVPDRRYSVGPNIGMEDEFKPGAIMLPHTDNLPIMRLHKVHLAMNGKPPVMTLPVIPITPTGSADDEEFAQLNLNSLAIEQHGNSEGKSN